MKNIYFLCAVVVLGGLGHTENITFFDNTHFKGESEFVNTTAETDCIDVPGKLSGRVSSVIVPSGFIRVYDELSCRGNSIMVNNANTACPGRDLSCHTKGKKTETRCKDDCDHPTHRAWNDLPKSFRFHRTAIKFTVLGMAMNTSWSRGSKVTYCTELTRKCRRTLTLRVSRATIVTKGKEFTSEVNTTTGWSEAITDSVTRAFNVGIFTAATALFTKKRMIAKKTSETSFQVGCNKDNTVHTYNF